MMDFPETHKMLTSRSHGFKLLTTKNPLEAYQTIHNSFISRFEIPEGAGTPRHIYIKESGVSVVIYDTNQFYVFYANQAITQRFVMDRDLKVKIRETLK